MTNKKQSGNANEKSLGQGSGPPLKLPCVEIVTPLGLWLDLVRESKQNYVTSAAPSEKVESLRIQARAPDTET